MAEQGGNAMVYDKETVKAIKEGKSPAEAAAEGSGEPVQEKQGTEAAISPSEERARKDGWSPKEDWNGDPEEWVNHREFNRRGELMGRIQRQTKEIRDMTAKYDEVMESLTTLAEHNSKLAEAERKKALKELRTEKATARREENDDLVAEIEDQIDELKDVDLVPVAKNASQEAGQQLTPAQSSIQRAWVDHPKSMDGTYSSPIVQGAIVELGDKMYEKHVDATGNLAGITAEKFMETLIGQVEEYLPQIFPGKKKRTPPSRVSDSGDGQPATRGKPGGKYGFGDLSDEQQRVCKKYEKQKIMTRQEYVDQIAAMQELPAQTGE